MKVLGVLVAAWLLLALAAPATAQVSGEATLAIEELPPGPASVNAGQTHAVPFVVRLMASGIQCTSASSVTVDLVLTNANAAPAGVVPSIDPPNLTIPIEAGPHGLPPPLPVGGPVNATGSATLRVVTPPTASGNFPASVSAVYQGGQPEGCVGTLPQAQASGTHAVTIVGQGGGNQTPPLGGGPGTGNNTTQPPPGGQPPPENRGMPGFGPELGLLALAAAAAVRLGRRRA